MERGRDVERQSKYIDRVDLDFPKPFYQKKNQTAKDLRTEVIIQTKKKFLFQVNIKLTTMSVFIEHVKPRMKVCRVNILNLNKKSELLLLEPKHRL